MQKLPEAIYLLYVLIGFMAGYWVGRREYLSKWHIKKPKCNTCRRWLYDQLKHAVDIHNATSHREEDYGIRVDK